MVEIKELAINQAEGKIEIENYGEIKAALADMMQVYKDMVYTEDKATVAKKDVSILRKIITAIESKRKEVKKACLKPYEAFEEQVRELVALINEPITLINTQLGAYEEIRLKEKRKLIQKIYDENIGEAAKYITLEKMYNPKWENVTYKEKQIVTDISELSANILMAVDTIKGMNSDAVEKALEQYKEDLSLSNAIAYINKYEAEKAEIIKKEQERREAEERARIEREKAERERQERELARKRIEEEERVKAEEQKKIDEAFANAGNDEEPEGKPFDTEIREVKKVVNREWHNITIKATKVEYEQIIAYIRNMGIEV